MMTDFFFLFFFSFSPSQQFCVDGCIPSMNKDVEEIINLSKDVKISGSIYSISGELVVLLRIVFFLSFFIFNTCRSLCN